MAISKERLISELSASFAGLPPEKLEKFAEGRMALVELFAECSRVGCREVGYNPITGKYSSSALAKSIKVGPGASVTLRPNGKRDGDMIPHNPAPNAIEKYVDVMFYALIGSDFETRLAQLRKSKSGLSGFSGVGMNLLALGADERFIMIPDRQANVKTQQVETSVDFDLL